MTRTKKEEEEILGEIRRVMAPAYTSINSAHDISHPQRMEKIANIVVDPNDVDPFLVKLAVWCHDMHRIGKTAKDIFGWLSDLWPTELGIIMDAVANHSKPNEDSDNPVLVYLKDIDRLDMGAVGILRIASHRAALPIYEASDFEAEPESTEEKDLQTMVHDLWRCLEWEGMLRTAGAKALGKKRFAFMRRFLAELERELKELGVIP